MAKGEEPRVEYPFITKAGILVAALLALWGVLGYFGFEGSYQEQYRDPFQIAAQSARLESFRDAVAADAVLGYLTDAAPGSEVSDAMFLSAQYTLAPRLLVKETSAKETNDKGTNGKKTNYQQVLGNFTRPGDFAAIGRQYGLSLQRDFGNGVVLYRGDAR
jgi:hypothetical protein